jgi:nicotinamide-nucleotide amidase
VFPDEIQVLAHRLVEACAARGLRIVAAESCTGGLVSAAITSIAGSSAVFDRGLITYSNAAKESLLGVPAGLIAEHGAVSEPVARAMAQGALERSGVDLSVAITGVAGPGGGTALKPVGLVHFAVGRAGSAVVGRVERFGDLRRQAIQLAAVGVALGMLTGQLS